MKPIALALLCTVAGTSGCIDDGAPCALVSNFQTGNGGNPFTRFSVDSSGHFFRPGAIDVDVVTQTIGMCPDGRFEYPESVRVRGFGPDGVELPVSASKLPGAAARVSLQADTPGWYHLEVTFLPIYGLTQVEVLVSETEPATRVETLPAFCNQLQRLNGDAWLCEGTVFRDGEAVNALVGNWFWTSGPHVWAASGDGTLRRYTEQGDGGLLPSGALAGSVFSVSSAAASGDELILRTPSTLERFEVSSDGGIRQTHVRPTAFGEFVHVAEGVALVDEFGGTAPTLQTYRAVDDGGFEPVGTGTRFSSALGASGDGIFLSAQGTDVRLVRATAEGPAGGASLTLPSDLGVQRTFGNAPVLSPMVFVDEPTAPLLRVTPGGTELELVLIEPVSFSFRGMGLDYAWGPGSEGGTQIVSWER